MNVWYGESFVMERKIESLYELQVYGIELISCSSGLCVVHANDIIIVFYCQKYQNYWQE